MHLDMHYEILWKAETQRKYLDHASWLREMIYLISLNLVKVVNSVA